MKAPFCVVVAKVGLPRLKFDFGEIRAQAWRDLLEVGLVTCTTRSLRSTPLMHELYDSLSLCDCSCALL
jgi:hypothetical protein